jgi:D-glycero-alpha-D-manno-heptose-7-phosphate kinase
VDLSSSTLEKLNSDVFLVRVGGRRSAANLLSSQNELLTATKRESNLVNNYLRMRDLVTLGESELKNGNLERLGELINESWELKKSFDPRISNDLVDTTILDGRKLGTYGAKLLGAGGSGYVLMLAPKDRHSDLMDHFEGRILKPRVDFDGTKVIYKSE